MNPGLSKFTGRQTAQPSPAGTAGGFTRRQRDAVIPEYPHRGDPRDRVYQDWRQFSYERSHPDALLESVDPDDLVSFTRTLVQGLRGGVTDPANLPSWLPPARRVEPSPEFDQRIQDLEAEEGRRLQRQRKSPRWGDLIDYKTSNNPGISRFAEEMFDGNVEEGWGTVDKARRRAIDDAGRRHIRGDWTLEELQEREEKVRRSRQRRGPDAPPTREELRQKARLKKFFPHSTLWSPWTEHTDTETGVRTYTNEDKNGVTHGISVPLGNEGHYVHETLVTKPQHFKAFNEAILNAMMLEQYLQSQKDSKDQAVQQALGPLIH